MQKKMFPFIIMGLLTVNSLVGCSTLMQIASTSTTSQAQGDPTPNQISSGLKEALTKGLGFAVDKLGAQNGFLGDAAVKILFPSEAKFAADKLRQIGLGSLVDDFETQMNRGAEDAVKQALPIFVDVLTSMSFSDVKNVLLGNETAATDFFKQRTSDALYNAFSPKIKASLDKVGAASTWTKVTSTYNSIPLVQKKVDTDIVRYATNKAMDGLFSKVAIEEAKIRQNPIFRTTELLKDIFGFADRMRSSGNTGSGTSGGSGKGNVGGGRSSSGTKGGSSKGGGKPIIKQ